MRKIFLLSLFLASLTSWSQTVRTEAEDYDAESGTTTVSITSGGDEPGSAVGYWNQFDYVTFNKTGLAGGGYHFRFRVAVWETGVVYELRNAATDAVLKTVPLPQTGAFNTFENVDVDVDLPPGDIGLKWVLVSANFGADFNWFEMTHFRDYGIPIVVAAPDTVITGVRLDQLADAVLYGSAADEDGSIASTSWRIISGGSGTIGDPTDLSTSFDDLKPNVYLLELSATDDDSNVGRDTMKITVRFCEGGKSYTVTPISGDSSDYYSRVLNYQTRDHQYTETFAWGSLPLLQGDTVKLSSVDGRFREVWFVGYGDSLKPKDCPIVFTSDGGVAWVLEKLQFIDCSNFKVTGRAVGDTNNKIGGDNWLLKFGYSTELDLAVSISGAFDGVEVDNIDVYNAQYGVVSKTDPPQNYAPPGSISPITCDDFYEYPNLKLKNVRIHHSRFRRINQDVIYGVNTDPTGERKYRCGSGVTSADSVNKVPARIENIEVDHLLIDGAGRTAIQVGPEFGQNYVHDNVVSNTGAEGNQQQGTAFSVGHGRNVYLYRNEAKNTFLYGFLDLGADTTVAFNNRIDSSGWMDLRAYYPTIDEDSVALLAGIFGVSHDGGFKIINDYADGITNIQATTKPTLPNYHKTVFYRNNRLGAGTFTSPTQNISFSEWGPAWDWTSNSQVCSDNLLLDGTTPAGIYREPMDHDNNTGTAEITWPPISTSCSPETVTADAGADQTVAGSLGFVMLSGDASTTGRAIVRKTWRYVSGPAVWLDQPNKADQLLRLSPGVYVFELEAMDDLGYLGTDQVQITVTGGSGGRVISQYLVTPHRR